MSDVYCCITAALLLDVLRGNADSCVVLLDHVYGRVSGILGDGPDAEDVAQETFLTIQNALRTGSFDPDAAGKPASWVLKIAIRKALDAKRRMSLRERVNDSSIDVDEIVDEHSLETETTADPASMRAALGTLTEDERQILLLRFIDGCSEEEVSSILDLPVGTVKSKCARARAKLRRALDAFTGKLALGGSA